MTATARVELRIEPAAKARLEQAAAYDHISVSAFVVSAVEQRVAEVLRRHTTVPADFFDALIDELDQPVSSDARLTRAVRSSRARAAKA